MMHTGVDENGFYCVGAITVWKVSLSSPDRKTNRENLIAKRGRRRIWPLIFPNQIPLDQPPLFSIKIVVENRDFPFPSARNLRPLAMIKETGVRVQFDGFEIPQNFLNRDFEKDGWVEKSGRRQRTMTMRKIPQCPPILQKKK